MYRWVWVKSVNCGDQKCATKSAAIKSYKWMSYIPSQNLQIAANLASLDGDEDDQMLKIYVLFPGRKFTNTDHLLRLQTTI